MAAFSVCPGCGALFDVPDHLAGQQVRCKSCRTVFVAVPGEGRRVPLNRPRPMAAPAPASDQPTASPMHIPEVAAAGPAAASPLAESTPPVVQPASPPMPQPARPVGRPVAAPRRKVTRSSSGSPATAWILGCVVVGGMLTVLAVVGAVVGYIVIELGRENAGQQGRVTPPPKVPFHPGGGPPFDPDLLAAPLWAWNTQELAEMEMHLSGAGQPEVLTHEYAGWDGSDGDLLRVPLDNPVPVLTPKEQQETVLAADGSLPRDVLERVERATVRLRVQRAASPAAPPFQGEGSGFFALAPGIVVTNAHVIGMKDVGAPAPSSIEVFVNSGEADEKRLTAKVLHADGHLDLALLQIQEKNQQLPEPLKLVSATTLYRTQLLVAFGFPYGENLNARMSTSKVSVASFVQEGREMFRIQMNGELNPGNSGGPVVDAQGRVVGVAVSIFVNLLRNTGISFAVPADHVWHLYHGRFGHLVLGPAGRSENGDAVVLPVAVEISDPLQRIREVGIAWTITDKSERRGPERAWIGELTKQPLPRPGSPQHTWRRGQVQLPPLPEDKMYLIQAYAISATDETRLSGSVSYAPFSAAVSVPVIWNDAVEAAAKPLNIAARYRMLHQRVEAGYASPLTVSLQCLAEPDGMGGISQYSDFRIGVRIGDRPLPRPLLDGALRRQGNDPQSFRETEAPFASAGPYRRELTAVHDGLVRILDILQVRSEGEELKPNQPRSRTVTLDGDPFGSAEPLSLQVTYTLCGVVAEEGRKLACVRFSGDVGPGSPNARGALHGAVWLDPATGRIVRGRACFDGLMQVPMPQMNQNEEVRVAAVWTVESPAQD